MRQSGLTLIELIVVLIILGAVSTGIASFVKSSVDNVVAVSTRDQLLSSSRFATERIKRELMQAVPNSIRIIGNANQHCLQYVPFNWASIVTNLPAISGEESSVQIVQPVDINGNVYAVQVDADRAIVYPLNSAEIYNTSSNKIRLVTAVSDDSDGNNLIELSLDDGFAEASPSQRLYLASEAVSFCYIRSASGEGRLVRFVSGITQVQPTAPASAVTIAQSLQNNLSINPAAGTTQDDPFRLFQASRLRNAIVQIRLRFSQNGDDIVFQQEVHIPNAP